MPLTVGKGSAEVTLASSLNPVLVQNAVTFTATVAATSGAPSGTVSFYDNTTSAAIG